MLIVVGAQVVLLLRVESKEDTPHGCFEINIVTGSAVFVSLCAMQVNPLVLGLAAVQCTRILPSEKHAHARSNKPTVRPRGGLWHVLLVLLAGTIGMFIVMFYRSRALPLTPILGCSVLFRDADGPDTVAALVWCGFLGILLMLALFLAHTHWRDQVKRCGTEQKVRHMLDIPKVLLVGSGVDSDQFMRDIRGLKLWTNVVLLICICWATMGILITRMEEKIRIQTSVGFGAIHGFPLLMLAVCFFVATSLVLVIPALTLARGQIDGFKSHTLDCPLKTYAFTQSKPFVSSRKRDTFTAYGRGVPPKLIEIPNT
jgi:hypothetical protein